MFNFSNFQIQELFALVVVGTFFIILLAQVTIPLTEAIPITGQSLAVLLVGYVLHSTLGTGAVILYLILGAIGIPVFADGASGWAVLKGTSGGYLLGFIPAAYVVGQLAERGWDTSFPLSLLAMTIGTALIILFGLMQLAYFVGFSKSLEYGLYPILPGAIIKIILGAAVLPLFYLIKKSF